MSALESLIKLFIDFVNENPDATIALGVTVALAIIFGLIALYTSIREEEIYLRYLEDLQKRKQFGWSRLRKSRTGENK